MPHRGLTVLANSELITRLRYRLGYLFPNTFNRVQYICIMGIEVSECFVGERTVAVRRVFLNKNVWLRVEQGPGIASTPRAQKPPPRCMHAE
jgi:hypothetical protein